MTTTVITRLFANKKGAQAVADRLWFERFPRDAVEVIAAKDGEDADSVKSRMLRGRVQDSAVQAYADGVMGGNALLIVRATYKPLQAPQIARGMLAQAETLDVGASPEEYKFKEPIKQGSATRVLTTHPRILTLPPEDDGVRRGTVTGPDGWGIPLVIKKKDRGSVIKGGRFMSRAFWPMPLLSRKPRKADSAMRGGGYMSRIFWPMPLVTNNKRSNSVIRGGKLFTRGLGFPMISR